MFEKTNYFSFAIKNSSFCQKSQMKKKLGLTFLFYILDRPISLLAKLNLDGNILYFLRGKYT